VQVRLEVTDLAGERIDTVQPGQEFLLRALATDLREDQRFAGVFGIWTDVWYRPELLDMPTAEGGKAADFAKPFVNGQKGVTTQPGVIDDVGAFAGSQATGTDELLVWSMKVRAKSAGLAEFVLDEADGIGNVALLYGMDEKVAWDQVKFVGASVEILAADGSVPEQNAFPVTVPDETPELPLLMPTPPDASDPVGQPRANARPMVVVPSPGQLPIANPVAPLVRIRLEVTNLDGYSIDSIVEGEEFVLRAYVDDLRTSQALPGVFGAYVDVWYRSELVDVLQGDARDVADFNAPFVDGRYGNTSTPGLIDEIGSFAGEQTPTGEAELPMWSIKVRAKAAGLAHFVLDDADVIGHDVLLHGLNEAVPLKQVEFVGDDLQITTADGTVPAINDFPVVPIEIDAPACIELGGVWIPAVHQIDTPPNLGTPVPTIPTFRIPAIEIVPSIESPEMIDSIMNPSGSGLIYSVYLASGTIGVAYDGDGGMPAPMQTASTDASASPNYFIPPPASSSVPAVHVNATTPEKVYVGEAIRQAQRATAVDVLMDYADDGVPHRLDCSDADEDESAGVLF
jgi:hypothetical protein